MISETQKIQIKLIISKIVGLIGYQITKQPDILRHSTRFVRKYLKGDLVVAEIGTLGGHNAFSLLKNLDIKKLYIIDPYKAYNGYNLNNPKTFSKAYREAKKRLKKYSNKIILLRKYSDEAVNDIPSCDFIYIDGNHNYNFVRRDIENYYKKVKKGGVLGGHDINIFDVSKAFIEFVAGKKIKSFIRGMDWWIIKK